MADSLLAPRLMFHMDNASARRSRIGILCCITSIIPVGVSRSRRTKSLRIRFTMHSAAVIPCSTSLPVTIAPWGDTAPALSRGDVRNISAPSCESAYDPSTVCRDLVSRPCETKKVPSQPLHTAALLEKEEKESACVEDYG